MNIEEVMKAIDMEAMYILPEDEFEPPISAYGSIDIAELKAAMNRYKTMPNYDFLIKENNKLAYKWNELIKRLMSKFNETQETFYLDIIQIMEEIDKNIKWR